MDKLVKDNIHLVRIIALNMIKTLQNVELEDVISYGYLGLVDASRKFNSSLGFKFSTYANVRIRGQILDEVRKAKKSRSKHKMYSEEISLDLVDSQQANPLILSEQESVLNRVKTAIKTLNYSEQTIINDFYLNELPQKPIANALGISQVRVSQIKKGALKKLKGLLND